MNTNTLGTESRALSRQAKGLLCKRLFDEAIRILRQIVDIEPSPMTMSWLIAGLIAAGCVQEAIEEAIRSCEISPYAWQAQEALGRALAARRDYEFAVQAFRNSAALRRGPVLAPVPVHLGLHNLEQFDYLSRNIESYPEFDQLRAQAPYSKIKTLLPNVDGETRASASVAGEMKANAVFSLPLFVPKQTAIREPLNASVDFALIDAKFEENGAGFAIIDDLLSIEALDSLRRFCLGATVWRRAYKLGYVGAFPEDGFASVLLFQIADALRQAMPGVLGDHRLAQWWGFAYDQRLSGTDVHADDADISVNLWITQTEANLQPDRGGLIMWDRTALDDWKFESYNGDSEKVRSWLGEVHATETIIPHRANRAVMFRGHLFHRSDGTNFAPGYENRRRSITFLFHRAHQRF